MCRRGIYEYDELLFLLHLFVASLEKNHIPNETIQREKYDEGQNKGHVPCQTRDQVHLGDNTPPTLLIQVVTAHVSRAAIRQAVVTAWRDAVTVLANAALPRPAPRSDFPLHPCLNDIGCKAKQQHYRSP